MTGPSTTNAGLASSGAGASPRRSRRALRFGLEPTGDGAYRIAAVQIRRGHVSAYEFATLVEGDSEKELRRLGYKRGLPAVLTLPRHDAILKWLRLPSNDAKQIAQMVRFEVRALAPWPEHETVFGYHVVSTDPAGYASLVFVIMRTDTVKQHIDALRALGVYPTRVEITTFSLGRLLDGLNDDERPAIARAAGGAFEYTRYWAGHPMFSRGAAGDDAAALVRDSLTLDERRHGRDQACTLLVLADSGDAHAALGGEAELRTIALADFRSPVLNGVAGITPEAAGCIGAALGADHGAHSEDLLSERDQRRLKLRRVFTEAAQVAALGVICAALLYFLSLTFIRQEQRFAQKARADIDALGENVGELKQKSEQIRRLRAEIDTVSAPLEVVLELYARTPSTVGINFLHYDGARPLVLAGEAPSFDVVNQFLSELNSSPQFDQVKLAHVSRTLQGQSDLVEFRMTLLVRGAAR